jgi:hypothetical protein
MKYLYKIWYCGAIVFLLTNSFIDVTHAQPLPTSEQQQKIEQLKTIFIQLTETTQEIQRVIREIREAQINNNNNNNRNHEVVVVAPEVTVVAPNDGAILMRANADAEYTETQARATMDREILTTAPTVNLDRLNRLLETFNVDLQRLQNTLNNDVLRIQIRETFRQLPVATTRYECDAFLNPYTMLHNRIANLVNTVEQMLARANREGRQLSQNQIAQAKRVLKIVQLQIEITARRAYKIPRTSTRKHTAGLLVQFWKKLQSPSAKKTEQYIIFLNRAPELLRHIRDAYAPYLPKNMKDILNILENMINDIVLTNNRLTELGSNNRGEIVNLLNDFFPAIISHLVAINNVHESGAPFIDCSGSRVLIDFFILLANESLANHNFYLLDIAISLCPIKVLRTILYMQDLVTSGGKIAELHHQEWEAIYYRIAAYLLRKNYRGVLWRGFNRSYTYYWLTEITNPDYMRDLLHMANDLTPEQQHEKMETIASDRFSASGGRRDRRYVTAALTQFESDAETAEVTTVMGENDVETADVTTVMGESDAETAEEIVVVRAPQRQETIQEELRRLLNEAEQIMRQLEAEEQARQEVINFINLEQQARGELEINWLDNLRQLLRSGVFGNLGSNF